MSSGIVVKWKSTVTPLSYTISVSAVLDCQCVPGPANVTGLSWFVPEVQQLNERYILEKIRYTSIIGKYSGPTGLRAHPDGFCQFHKEMLLCLWWLE